MAQTVILAYPAPQGLLNRAEYQGKFIQFALHGRLYLVFAPSELHRFHSQILGHFLTDHEIPHHWVDDQTLETDSPDLAVIGGGKYSVDTRNRTLELRGDSQAYGRFDSRDLTAHIASADHPWSGFHVHIA